MNFFPALSHERNQKQYHPKSQESMILDTRAGTEEVQDEPGTFCCARMRGSVLKIMKIVKSA